MADRMEHKGITLDIPYLEEHLKTKIALVSSRKGFGIAELNDCHIQDNFFRAVLECIWNRS
jgi:Fe2+ transport system protein B